MVPKGILKEIIQENEDRIQKIPTIVGRRNVLLPQQTKKVVVFYGVRRSGKTYCLFDIFRKNTDRAMYVDFEDERLVDFRLTDFEGLLEAFFELKPDRIGKGNVLLLDEVQNVKGWERFGRRVTEGGMAKVFVAGSSSKMTPAGLQTTLRGRSWGIALFPFSFPEYLTARGLDPKNRRLLYGEGRYLIQKYFREYIQWGGFPEICFAREETEKHKILKEYLEAIFFKDLVERFEIHNLHLLDALQERLFSSCAAKVSLNAFYKQFKGKFPFSKDHLFAYYRYFLESLIVFEARMFSSSPYQRLRNPAKIYLVDVGMTRHMSAEDRGRRLENIVYIELKRRGEEVYYFQGKGGECDFLVQKERGVLPIQVTWEMTPQNREREFQGLQEACRFLKVKRGILLTADKEDEEKVDGIHIHILPVWKWLFSL